MYALCHWVVYQSGSFAARKLAGGSGAGTVKRLYPRSVVTLSLQYQVELSAPHNLVKLAKLAGTFPLNWFPLRSRWISSTRFPNAGGIEPLSWLFSRLRYHIVSERLPNDAGIVPVSWLLLR